MRRHLKQEHSACTWICGACIPTFPSSPTFFLTSPQVFVTATGRTVDLALVVVESEESVLLLLSPGMQGPVYDRLDRHIFPSDKACLDVAVGGCHGGDAVQACSNFIMVWPWHGPALDPGAWPHARSAWRTSRRPPPC